MGAGDGVGLPLGHPPDAQDSERSAARTLGGVTSLGGLALILWPGTGVVAWHGQWRSSR